MPLPVAAAGQCGITYQVQALVDDMRQVVQYDGQMPRDLADQLGQSAGAVSMPRVNERLTSLALSKNGNAVKNLVRTANQISDSGNVGNLSSVTWNLNVVERLITAACRADPEPIEVLSIIGIVSEFLFSTTMSADPFIHGKPREMAARLSVLLAFLAITITAMFLARAAYLRGYAVVYNRRACRIAATLELGLDVVDVHITILGQRGCRIQPVNEGAFKRIETLARHEEPTVIIGPHHLPIRIDGLHEYFISSFFIKPISRRLQTTLLAASALPPVHVTKSIPKSNVKAPST